MPILTKKYEYLVPLEFFEDENFVVRAQRTRAENLDLDF